MEFNLMGVLWTIFKLMMLGGCSGIILFSLVLLINRTRNGEQSN